MSFKAADWHEAITRARSDIVRELRQAADVGVSAGVLNIERGLELTDKWPTAGWHREQQVVNYRLALLRGVSAAHFLRKASGSNSFQ
jgi:asparagine synthase (glutamine-hydrolysing)